MPKDHYNLYKNVTSFSFVELKDLLKEFNHKHSNQLIQKEVNQFVESGEEFRKRIKEKKLIKQNPFRRCENDGSKTKIGIPQGTPISAFLANLYLLQFDKQILELVKDTSTVYRRYSDDILIICPKEDFEKLESKAYELIEHYNLIIQSSKTQRSFFFNGKLLKGQKPVNYLGFQFDGNRKLLKSVSISKFYRKVKRNVKYRAVRALVARKKRDAGVVVDATLHRRKLYEQFSFKGKAKSSIKKRNFFSYVYFASRVMKSDHIKNQLSGSWNILHKEIDRYEKKFKLDKIQKRSQKLILKVLHSEQDE